MPGLRNVPRPLGYHDGMTRLPNGERAEQIEDLENTEVTERIDKDPEEQKNREEMSHPEDPTRSADRD